MIRVMAGLRVLMIEERSALAWPWGILVLAFTANVGIWAFLDESARESSQTFGISALLVVWFVVYVQMVNDVFPFAVGFGLTRGAFAAAIAGHASAHAVAYGVVVAVLTRVESATGGWGIDLLFFAPAGMGTGNAVTDAVAWAAMLLAVAALAVFPAAVHGHWGARGLYVVGAGTVAIGGAFAVALTAADGWGRLLDWFAGQSVFLLMAVWPLVLGAVLAAASYATLRRMVP